MPMVRCWVLTTMPKRQHDRAYMARVAELPCVVCGAWPVHVHHRTGAGMGRKADDYQTIPLCPLHHQHGGEGVAIHSGTKTWESIHGTQDEHIKETQRKLGYGMATD
jgi:hypothetical protein